jgi:hypothetical protein
MLHTHSADCVYAAHPPTLLSTLTHAHPLCCLYAHPLTHTAIYTDTHTHCCPPIPGLPVSIQVPFLSREREAQVGQAVTLEALQSLYCTCKYDKRAHLELAATSGIVPHLCR